MTARGTYNQEGENVYLWKNLDGSYEYVPAKRWRRTEKELEQKILVLLELTEQMEKQEQLVEVAQVLQIHQIRVEL